MEGKVIVESHNKANNRVATHAVHCSDSLENSIFSRTGMIYLLLVKSFISLL